MCIEGLRRSGAVESNSERWALEVYVAGRYAPLSVRSSSFGGALQPYRELANDIATRHRTVSDADLVAALKLLGRDRVLRLNRMQPDGVLASALSFLGLLLSRLGGVLGYC